LGKKGTSSSKFTATTPSEIMTGELESNDLVSSATSFRVRTFRCSEWLTFTLIHRPVDTVDLRIDVPAFSGITLCHAGSGKAKRQRCWRAFQRNIGEPPHVHGWTV